MANSGNDISSTECSVPPPLTDDELLTALDGDPAIGVQTHLEQCAFCSAKLEAMRMFEDSLHTAMYRADCPPSDQLVDYLMGPATTIDPTQIEQHIQQCMLCREEVESLRAIFGIAEAPKQREQVQDSVWEQFKSIFQSLGDQLVRVLVPQPPLAYGQLKGNQDSRGRLLTYTNEPVSVMLSLEKTMDTLKINGSIVDTEAQNRWSGSLIELVSTGEDQRLYATFADDDEMFTLNGIKPGHFNLSIYGTTGQILRLHDIEIVP